MVGGRAVHARQEGPAPHNAVPATRRTVGVNCVATD